MADALVTRIEPPRGVVAQLLIGRRGLEVTAAFVRRDLTLRFRDKRLGLLWALVQPLLTTAILSAFAPQLGGGQRPWLFVGLGVVPWLVVANAVGITADAMTSSRELMKRAYFPRISFPLAAVAVALVEMAPAGAVLAIAAVALGGARALAGVLAGGALAVIVAFGAALALGAVVGRFRDARYALGFFLQLWMLSSPLFYDLRILPARVLEVLAWNPMAAVAAWSRAGLAADWPPLDAWWRGALAALVLVPIALTLFQRFDIRISEEL